MELRKELEKSLTGALGPLGLELTEKQLDRLHIYYENLIRWNKVMNLTAITEEKDVYEKHFLDSLMICRILPPSQWSEGTSIIDVGTGAGFPGLPIAICFPQAQVTLMDSLGKRIRFLEDTAANLGLANVRAIHARAEELARNSGHREQYDLCVSRAVANLSTLSEYCLPLVTVGGVFLAMKAHSEEEETEAGKAIALLGGTIEKTDTFKLPGTDMERTIIVVRKIRPTPARFPRKAGTPSKTPIV